MIDFCHILVLNESIVVFFQDEARWDHIHFKVWLACVGVWIDRYILNFIMERWVEWSLDLNIVLINLIFLLNFISCLNQINLHFLIWWFLIAISNSIAFLCYLFLDIRQYIIIKWSILVPFTRLDSVPTLLAFAFAGTWDSSFKAFAIFLLAHWILAIATLEVLILIFVHFAFEGFDISFQDIFNCLHPFFLMVIVIEAVTMFVTLALRATCCIVS